jgi:hypothetical protein
MAANLQERKWVYLMRFRTLLENTDNPLSSREIHFVQICCQILRNDSEEKVSLSWPQQCMEVGLFLITATTED